MNIRSITTLMDLSHPLQAGELQRAGELAARVRDALNNAGFNVQTMRAARQILRAAAFTYVAAAAMSLFNVMRWFRVLRI